MKKIIIILFLFFFSSPAFAVDYNQGVLNESCFKNYSTFEAGGLKTIKVSFYSQDSLIFVQEDNLIPFKFYEKKPDEFIDYNILRIGNVSIGDGVKLKSFNDNNLLTEYQFNPAESDYSILIDSGEILKSGSYDFFLNLSKGFSNYKQLFYISNDGKEYLQVKQPGDFDFRYLEIVFEKIRDNDIVYPLAVSEINIKRKGKKIYLVNPIIEGKVDVYSGYSCNDTNFELALFEIQKSSRVEEFKIDSRTKYHDLFFSKNTIYDDDFDNDDINNDFDNCPYVANSDQFDSDKDGKGDVCDLDSEVKNYNEKDSDKDGVGDRVDNCPTIYNPKQKDMNADKKGDLCADDDRDGHIGSKDNCVYISNRDQKDINANGIGDACEFDKDKDGVFDSIDNCVNMPNRNQSDMDKDDIGDICDNCKIYNPQQKDENKNGIGDKCEEKEIYIKENDMDKDGILDGVDNCKKVQNTKQEDRDGDRIGDACDNCIQIKNYDQKDSDENGVGDLCDDADGDGILGYLDNCPNIDNADQSDVDNNGIGDVCGDDDRDRVVNAHDNCEFKYNPKQGDVDRDGIGDMCDDYDDRAVESNKTLFKIFIGVVTIVFGGLIFFMINKMKKEEGIENNNDNN